MEIAVAASTIGKRRFFIDITHWDRVDRFHKPFLVNPGHPAGLSVAVFDLSRYINEVAQIYKEASEALASARREFVKSASRAWPLRFLLPARIEPPALGPEWEIKTHVENVIGKKFGGWGEVLVGRVAVEVRDRAVYIGGVPSIGHTYLRMLGALSI